MSYFYNKFLEASVADVIQTPDDVGNDLDAIEKAIEGNDGIEAHRDEVEDAVEGLIGDPVEECMVIMAEADYNFNKFMKELGIRELMEAEGGEEPKDEKDPSKAKAFLTKVGQWFQQMWEKIVKIIDNVLMRLGAHEFNKYVSANNDSIKNGYENGTWTIKLHDLKKVQDTYLGIMNNLDKKNKVTIDMLKNKYGSKMPEADVIKDITDMTAESIKDLTAKYEDIGEVEYSNTNNGGLYDVLTDVIGPRNAELKELMKAKAGLKKNYLECVRQLKRAKDDEVSMDAANNAMFATKVMNAMAMSGIKLLNMLCLDCYKAAKALNMANPDKPKKTAKHENAYININIV